MNCFEPPRYQTFNITAWVVLLVTLSGCNAAERSEHEVTEAFRSLDVAVAGLTKHMSTDEPGGAGSDCRDWQLTAVDVKLFFAKAERLTGEEFHASYYTLPCNYTGSIRAAGLTYSFEINGGAHALLRGAALEEPILYGCRNVCANQFARGLYDDEQ